MVLCFNTEKHWVQATEEQFIDQNFIFNFVDGASSKYKEVKIESNAMH